MAFIRAMLRVMFRSYASPRAIRGNGGKFNEQCHPMCYL
jgi:hypothetical protein